MSTMKSLQDFMKDYQEDPTITQYSRLLDVLNDLTIIAYKLEGAEDLLNFSIEFDADKNPMDPTKMKVCDRDILKAAYLAVMTVRGVLKGVSE